MTRKITEVYLFIALDENGNERYLVDSVDDHSVHPPFPTPVALIATNRDEYGYLEELKTMAREMGIANGRSLKLMRFSMPEEVEKIVKKEDFN